MKHLTIDEIIEFVMTDSISTESMTLMTSVTTHIVRCPECLKKVQAYQHLYEKFKDLEDRGVVFDLLNGYDVDGDADPDR